MSFSRYRHIFTLGTLRRSKRWQPADPFECDPFKINSYNFRYAERPSLPLPFATQTRNDNETSKDCQTYFYNQDFSNTNNLNAASSAKNKRQLYLSKYQDYRKRRFFNPPRFHRRWPITRTEENSLNINQNHPALSSTRIPDNNTSQACAKNDLKPPSIQHFQKVNHTTTPPSTANCLDSGHILGSGCEINININGLENNSLHENLNINIETDSMTRNLNIPLSKSMKHSNLTTGRIQQLKSSNSFVIDKRLSKFCSNHARQSDVRIKEKERAKELTSIYSSHMLNRTPIATDSARSREQLPFRTNSFRASKSSVMNGNLAAQKSFIQSVRDNLSVYDSKASKKSCSRHNLHRSSYKLNYRESNDLNSFAKTPPKASSSQRVDSKSMLSSAARLPLNININLFADKLKE